MKISIQQTIENYKNRPMMVVITANGSELDSQFSQVGYLRGEIYDSSSEEFATALREIAKLHPREKISVENRGI